MVFADRWTDLLPKIHNHWRFASKFHSKPLLRIRTSLLPMHLAFVVDLIIILFESRYQFVVPQVPSHPKCFRKRVWGKIRSLECACVWLNQMWNTALPRYTCYCAFNCGKFILITIHVQLLVTTMVKFAQNNNPNMVLEPRYECVSVSETLSTIEVLPLSGPTPRLDHPM